MKKKIIFFLLLVVASACSKTEYPVDPFIEPQDRHDKTYVIKDYLRREYMNVYYYWYKEVKGRNARLDPDNYSLTEFFDAMLYDIDRWSWMCDGDYFRSLQTGVYSGTWGVSLGQALDYDDYAIYIEYIFPGSPFETYGVTRGARLDAIGGYDLTSPFTQEKRYHFNEEIDKDSNTFTFHLVDGSDTTFTASKAGTLSTRSALGYEIITPEDYPGLTSNVGYFNYLSFKASMLDDITGAMACFKENGVRNLILDMRYNSGGDVAAGEALMSYIAPHSAQGQPYLKVIHNDLLSQFDYTDNIPDNEASLDLDNIYIITGPQTASCSETIINGLAPYMGDKVHKVGQRTYGKPNGMYALLYPGEESDYLKYNSGDFSGVQYAFLPIAMYDMNSLGEQIPDDGFVPDCYWPDDIYNDFGVAEGCIAACLGHLVTGTYPQPPSVTKSSRMPEAVMAGPERDPHYGTAIHKLPEVGSAHGLFTGLSR